MKSEELLSPSPSVLSRTYWRDAARQISRPRMLVFAALIVALRVAVKFAKIPVMAGLSVSLDCYVNSLGSLVYGPLMGLMVGAVSDTLGCILQPTGDYFLPFILVEMSSSFLFGLFFWRQKLSPSRALLAKFSVNFVCNIVLTSVFYKWQLYLLYGVEKAEAYHLVNLVRIGKNLVLFPVEAFLIVLVLAGMSRPLHRLGLLGGEPFRIGKNERLTLAVQMAFWLVFSVGLILLYVFWGKGFLSTHNIKLF